MLTRWDPFADMWTRANRLQNLVNRVLETPEWGNNREPRLGGAYPALDVWGDEENLYLEAELPGMELADLEIYVTGGNQLALRGERKQPSVDGSWHRQERGFGPFSRVLTLPVAVDADRVEAKLQHGVLTVTLPKAREAKPRRITVKTD
jgi:HSP20 family protein